MKNNFSENRLQILCKCQEYSGICHTINYLLIGLLMPYCEILSSRFFTYRPRKLGLYFKTTGFKYSSISQYNNALVNSKDENIFRYHC